MLSKNIEVKPERIAIELAKYMPLDGADFRLKVVQIENVIKRLPKLEKRCLAAAYVFSRKCPRQDREDLFQDLMVALLEVKPLNEKLTYSMARFRWIDWYRKLKSGSKYSMVSLDAVISDDDNDNQSHVLSEILIGDMEFEQRECEKMDCRKIIKSIPANIRKIGYKRLTGKALTNTERSTMCRYIKQNPMILTN